MRDQLRNRLAYAGVVAFADDADGVEGFGHALLKAGETGAVLDSLADR
jgi:hypothetical protein